MTDATRLPIRRALLSVSDKAGLSPLAEALAGAGVELISTGGTAQAIRDLGLAVRDVSEVTGAPEMMDGRVKTLHPRIHGGLLARRELETHLQAAEAEGVPMIDLLVVNLYPFEATVASGAGFSECVEQIDIGGPAMIRAAAKNHAHVAVLTDPADYGAAIEAVAAGGTTEADRRGWAAKAFARTAGYDAAISGWFAGALGQAAPERLTVSGSGGVALRYGENPHQAAAVYRTAEARPGVASATQIQGKALSYNNLNDADAAFELVGELDRFERPACVVIKHANPSGAALGDTLAEAYRRARDCDRTSAFGGVIAFNRPLDAETAREVAELFTEVVIAPEADAGAREAFAAKRNLRLLTTGGLPDPAAPGRTIRTLAGGFLAQDRDARLVRPEDLRVVTKRAPTPGQISDLMVAWTVAKHVKSNAIVYAKGGATVGVGAGQMSRVDSTRIAARKAEEMASTLGLAERPTKGAVVASDAFFPFADGLLTAAEAGAVAVIQPGGSVRDEEVIRAADEAGLAMVFTGVRHFRH
ncbi:MAG: bifunctional phosphoribosylaminoimidazolecarboxamide formyltransferase/IMP cyclohydrolase [Pseudomonadota bacterium]